MFCMTLGQTSGARAVRGAERDLFPPSSWSRKREGDSAVLMNAAEHNLIRIYFLSLLTRGVQTAFVL